MGLQEAQAPVGEPMGFSEGCLLGTHLAVTQASQKSLPSVGDVLPGQTPAVLVQSVPLGFGEAGVT